MYNHATADYICPICLSLEGTENQDTLILQSDIVYRDDLVTVIINSFSLGGVIGNAIIVPVKHFENIYDMPDEYGHHVFDLSKRVAIAMKKAYGCDGITTMQCSEPAGDQHAFHYHFHVMQRYDEDRFNEHITHKEVADPKMRAVCAEKLRSNID